MMLKHFRNQNQKLYTNIGNDFLGVLKGYNYEEKVSKVFGIYQYFSKFQTKLMGPFVDNEIMMLILFQYLRKTKMRRIHERGVLSKNINSYYTALENIINNSTFKKQIFTSISSVFEEDEYEIITDKDRSPLISFEKLKQANMEAG